jgi:hypothetical protein
MGNSIATDYKTRHPEELNEQGTVKVCIGGGAGFIGSHIAKELKKQVCMCVCMHACVCACACGG